MRERERKRKRECVRVRERERERERERARERGGVTLCVLSIGACTGVVGGGGVERFNQLSAVSDNICPRIRPGPAAGGDHVFVLQSSV